MDEVDGMAGNEDRGGIQVCNIFCWHNIETRECHSYTQKELKGIYNSS